MEESHRTRSKAAPDWTVEEALILVNEVTAVESEWGANLPSFQKWQQIVENCNALDVNRSLNQCKRHWDTLLTAYWRLKHGAPPDRSFPAELFTAVDRCLITKEKTNDGEEEEEKDVDDDANEAKKEDEQVAMEIDPDSDPEAQGHAPQFFFETGSKKQRRRMKRQKRRIEARNPWGYFTSTITKHEESASIHEKVKDRNIIDSMGEEMNVESEEQRMATMLWENAVQMNAILEGNLGDDLDYTLADLKNAEAVKIDLTRRKGDKLIDCLEKISTTLNQLCDIVQK